MINAERNIAVDEETLVSVIIPVYNSEKFIIRAVESVLAQSVSLELIIINDCSTDRTEYVLKPYLKRTEIHYYKNEHNLGVAKSRNKGVSLARGRYVAFLDADDWWAHEKLLKQLDLLDKTKMVLCSTARQMVDINGTILPKVIPVAERISHRMLLRHNCINCSSVVLRKEVADEFPMEHDDSHEDYITWLKILKKYGYACALNEPLLYYTIGDQGKSGSKIKSAKMTFKAYRYAGFSFWRSVLSFFSYALNGIIKHWPL